MNTQKVIIFSSMISANMVVWYEILGMRFIIGAFLAIACLMLWPGETKRSKGGGL